MAHAEERRRMGSPSLGVCLGLVVLVGTLLQQAGGQDSPCPPLTKELLQPHARQNMIMLTLVDRVLYHRWIPSHWASAQKAGITYNFIGALDNETALALRRDLKISRCFTPDHSRLRYKLKEFQHENEVAWGSGHWHETTWSKVYILRMVFDMGFVVMHADSDITWFKDPFPYFRPHIESGDAPPHMILTLDSMSTENQAGEEGLEKRTSPYLSINTGVYFLKHWPHDKAFMDEWFRWYSPSILNDQHALNHVIRGKALTGRPDHPDPIWDKEKRLVWAAFNKTAAISFLPPSQFGNSYTYMKGRVHTQLNHTLYEVHWVWSGAAYNKQQNMRDSGVFLDPPEYYAGHPGDPLNVLSMDLEKPKPLQGINFMPNDQMETMVEFHVWAASLQLQQMYYGLMAATVLNRTFVMPRTDCYCSRNWFRMYSCRIEGEPHTKFPYTCTMQDLLRARYALKGLELPLPWGGPLRRVHLREVSFLENPRTPEAIKTSRLTVMPGQPRTSSGDLPQNNALLIEGPIDGSGPATLRLPWPLTAEELAHALSIIGPKFRSIHITDAPKLLANGYKNATQHYQFDVAIRSYATFWCCRSPEDRHKFGKHDGDQLNFLPPSRSNAFLAGSHVAQALGGRL